MAKLMFVENKDGRQFSVKILLKDDKYGLNKSLIWENDEPGIEFYDVTYAGVKGFDEIGQYVTRYFLESILEHVGYLSLIGYVPNWTIDANNIEKIKEWVKKQDFDKDSKY